jgi:hypothetical protein
VSHVDVVSLNLRPEAVKVRQTPFEGLVRFIHNRMIVSISLWLCSMSTQRVGYVTTYHCRVWPVASQVQCLEARFLTGVNRALYPVTQILTKRLLNLVATSPGLSFPL